MNQLIEHIYNQAWDYKNIRLAYSSKQNLYLAGAIVVLGFIASKQIEKTK
jgi:hypothetical protein